jgi:hypothetical protein
MNTVPSGFIGSSANNAPFIRLSSYDNRLAFQSRIQKNFHSGKKCININMKNRGYPHSSSPG